jgi:hypothetical protein
MIDPDVRGVAKDFGLDADLLQAIVTAEGNIVRAVQCSVPSVTTRDQALRITARSVVHRMCDFTKAHDGAGFVKYMQSFWAPTGAENDPQNLNANWAPNVTKLWGV